MNTHARLLVAALWLAASATAGFAQGISSPGYLGLMLDDRPWNIGGVPVMRVHAQTPAEAAGFQVGDIVVTCNGARVRDITDFARAIYQVPVGGRAVIEVQRGGSLLELTAVLSEGPLQPLENFRPPLPPEISTGHPRAARPLLGLVVRELQTRSYGLFGSLRQAGVVVEDIVPDSPAEKHRVPRGAILTSLNGIAVRTPDDVFAIMERVPEDRPVELTYVLGGSAYRQLIPLTDLPALPREVAKPLEEGTVIETPDELPPPTPAPPSDDSLPALPLPALRPEEATRLPPRAVPAADDVRAMRSELEELRRRAAAIQVEIEAIRSEAAKPE